MLDEWQLYAQSRYIQYIVLPQAPLKQDETDKRYPMLRGLIQYIPAILWALGRLSRALSWKPALLKLIIFPREWRAERLQHSHLFQW